METKKKKKSEIAVSKITKNNLNFMKMKQVYNRILSKMLKFHFPYYKFLHSELKPT